MPLEIQDSEDSGGDGFDGFDDAAPAPTSGEMRLCAIEAARMLIAPSVYETVADREGEGASGGEYAAAIGGEYAGEYAGVDGGQETIGVDVAGQGAGPIEGGIAEQIAREVGEGDVRVNGDAQAEGDVYNPPDDDDDFLPAPAKKTKEKAKKSAATEAGRPRTMGNDSDSDFGAPKKKPAKKTKPKPKQRSRTAPHPIIISDDFAPATTGKPRSITAPHPIVISDSDVAPATTTKPRAKTEIKRKRDLTRELQDFLPLPSPPFAIEIQQGQVQATGALPDYMGLGDGGSPMSTIPDPPEMWAGLGVGEVGGGVDSDGGAGGMRIASEWRAAKAKGRQNLSDKPVRQSPVLVPVADGNAEQKQRKPTPKRPTKERKKKEQNEDPPLPVVDNNILTTEHEVTMELNVNPDPAPAPTATMVADSDGDMDAPLSSPPLSPVEPLSKKKSKPPKEDEGYGDSIAVAPAAAPVKRKRTTSKKDDAPVDDGDGGEWNGENPKATAKRKRTTAAERAQSRLEANEPEEKMDTIEQDPAPAPEAIEDVPAALAPEPAPAKPKAAAKRKRTKTADPPADPEDTIPPPAPVEEEELRTPIPPPVTPETSKKKKQLHSPLKSGKVPYRVGLSKRARIEPLLSVRPREKKRDA
ncbi:hypothetical protein BZA05DRAFT_385633 [Tricharina praecox]|uniref:uncharacterized protein n=1 Tax=Tricharina praecox TaxID=43433 RepID=UPI00221F5D9F|nr:uncharacterized protein BZA05DRAFT_385633 [Tricharina praecox]KAI5858027.1 hypothetical protein BZA05DRAFT_385633 [Tricharina praecox]